MSPKSSVRTEVDGREVVLTNLEKVLYPATGFTKGQVLDYYAKIAPVMLPHLRDRPLTMKRYPDGVESTPFFEKHASKNAPAWMPTITVPSSAETPGEPVTFLAINDLASLIWAANLASIEFHVPLWHAGRRRKLPAAPDHMVFDLDPGDGASIVECCRAALHIVEHLTSRFPVIYPKTSGSKGLQLYAPLSSTTTFERLRGDARTYAQTLEKEQPELIVSNMRKALRTGKVLIDWSQNSPSKTTVAAYSLRGVPTPSASTPVSWDEVAECARRGDPALLRFSPADVVARADSLGDLFVPATMTKAS